MNAAVEYSWETHIRGTLFRDDLGKLEELVAEDGKFTEWQLIGDRELGEAELSVATLNELVARRLDVGAPKRLVFRAGRRFGLQLPDVDAAWLELEPTDRYTTPPAFIVRIGGNGAATRDRFDRYVRGMSELKGAIESRQPIPAVQGPRRELAGQLAATGRVVSNVAFALFAIPGWVVVFAVLFAEDRGALPSWVGLVGLPFGIAWLVSWRLTKRLDRLMRWRVDVPLFDLANESRAFQPVPVPSFIARDVALWLAGAALAVVLAIGTLFLA